MIGLGAEFEKIGDFVVVGGEVVDGVGVVPEDAEIGSGGGHGGEALNGFGRVNFSSGIGVFGDAPDAFNVLHGIGDESFDLVQVGAVSGERDGEHADAVLLADGEVAIVLGDWAEEGGGRVCVW